VVTIFVKNEARVSLTVVEQIFRIVHDNVTEATKITSLSNHEQKLRVSFEVRLSLKGEKI